MPIKFFCNSCGAKLKVPEAHIGKKARCPKCGEKNRVPFTSQREDKPKSEISAGDFEDVGDVLQRGPTEPLQLPASPPLAKPKPKTKSAPKPQPSTPIPVAATPVLATPVTATASSIPPIATPVAANPAVVVPQATPVSTHAPAGIPALPTSGPFASPLKPATGSGGNIEPLYENRTWIRILAWLLIICGVICCLTIVGAIIGWVYIWMGLCLKGAADSIEYSFESGVAAHATEAFTKLGTFFKIVGIMILISLIPAILYFALLIFIFTVAIFSGVT